MKTQNALIFLIIVAFGFLTATGQNLNVTESNAQNKQLTMNTSNNDFGYEKKLNEYATITLKYSPDNLSENEKQLIPLLIRVSEIMDELFWMQSYGSREKLMSMISDKYLLRLVEINYGPWDRMDNNKAFSNRDQAGKKKQEAITTSIAEANKYQTEMRFDPKPLGAGFYPADMTKDEFEKLEDDNKKSLYTIITRSESGQLDVVWYHKFYKKQIEEAANLLQKASEVTEDPELKKYLAIRSEALLTSNYQESDIAWMEMKKNRIDFVVGPIENYEDALFGYKAAFEAFVLVKDLDWSAKLEKFTKLLPDLQKNLPVANEYKKEIPGTSSDLGVYDALYYAGDCNAGSKTIAINLPNDEEVQLKMGSRRLQLKNVMQAKFDKILLPIAEKLIDKKQFKLVKFDAFFNNVMFHEVAHGLGIKNTINNKGTVRDALKDVYSSFEEAKADILGLYIVTKLIESGQITELTADECYVTFVAGIFRSVRFGASSAHGKANMMCFNFMIKNKVILQNTDGTFTVNISEMKKAVSSWVETIILFQGNGDYEGAMKYLKENAFIPESLQKSLEGLKSANIPKDIVFEQGLHVLGL